MIHLRKLLPFFFVIFIVFTIFWQFFIKGLHPFPGNFMLAWYEPWKTNYTIGQTITIPHKPVADDTFRYLYPFKILGIESLKNLEFPLWNPYNGAGMPLLATYQWGFFNPFNVFFFILQPETAWSFYVIAQVFLLSFSTYLYCRKIKISTRASIFATVVFLFSGFVVVRLIFGNLIYPLTTLPLILYLIEDYIECKNSKKIFLLPFVIAFMLLSGHPHIMIYVIIFSFSYFLYRVLSINKTKEKISKSLFFILLFSVGVGIASIQIIPTIELLKNSNMNISSSSFVFDRFLLPASHLMSMLIPNYFGNQATYNYWGAGDYIETIAAVGLIPSFFAYLALFGKNSFPKDRRAFFFGAFIISILSTLNWFLPKLLYALPIPVISTSPPSRIFVLTSFSIAILSGFGFDKWMSLKKVSRMITYQVAAFALMTALLLIITFILFKIGASCHNEIITNCRLIALRNTILEVSFFISMLTLFFVYLVLKNKIVRYLPFLIIFLVLVLGLYNSNKFLPFSPKDTIMQKHPLFTFLGTHIDRAFCLGEANIKTNFATHFRFFDSNYFDPLHNKRYAELIGYANTKHFPPLLKRSDIEIIKDLSTSIDNDSNSRRKTLFNILAIRYIILKKRELSQNQSVNNVVWKDENWVIQENKDSLPRAYIVNDFEIVSNPESILKRLFSNNFNYREKIILEEKPKLNKTNAENINIKPKITAYKTNNLSIDVNATSDSLLVLSDNYYPGWKAYVDGEETKIYRANYTFRAVYLPKGEHRVRFAYNPNSFRIGLGISAISFILALIIPIFLSIRQKYATT